MDSIVILLLAAAAVYLLFRLRRSIRSSRNYADKSGEIQNKLAELRKKRDEQ